MSKTILDTEIREQCAITDEGTVSFHPSNSQTSGRIISIDWDSDGGPSSARRALLVCVRVSNPGLHGTEFDVILSQSAKFNSMF